jgi:hypothetical protein
MLFVAPTIAGSGPRFLGELPEPLRLLHPSAERLGDDVLLSGYLREP